ncbi:MAG: MerR family transcriptional regulator [Thermoleophilaceae bacterium]
MLVHLLRVEGREVEDLEPERPPVAVVQIAERLARLAPALGGLAVVDPPELERDQPVVVGVVVEEELGADHGRSRWWGIRGGRPERFDSRVVVRSRDLTLGRVDGEPRERHATIVACGHTGPMDPRGAYTANRAAALSGVPRSTVHYWARQEILSPSVSPVRVRLWSYADLMGLRTIYWLRQPKSSDGGAQVPASTMPQVRKALEALRALDLELWSEDAGPAVAVDRGEMSCSTPAATPSLPKVSRHSTPRCSIS